LVQNPLGKKISLDTQKLPGKPESEVLSPRATKLQGKAKKATKKLTAPKRNQVLDISQLKKYGKTNKRSIERKKTEISDYKREFSEPEDDARALVKTGGWRKIADPTLGLQNEGLRFFSDINEETNFGTFMQLGQIEVWRKILVVVHFLLTLGSAGMTLSALIQKYLDCGFKTPLFIV
jgi:hypothetical protein